MNRIEHKRITASPEVPEAFLEGLEWLSDFTIERERCWKVRRGQYGGEKVSGHMIKAAES